MKKLLIIIGILLVVFIGMFVYKTQINKANVTISEIENIENYISKIYMWKEVTEDALPKFDNINEAPEKWIWEVVKKNCDKYELLYEEIQEMAYQIFSEDFKKKFPKEGTEYIQYNEEHDRYIATGMGLDTLEDSFYIKNIKKVNNGYEVEVLEYLEDYGISMYLENPEENYDVYIKNLKQEIVATVKNEDDEIKIINAVKENIDKFSTKTVNLRLDSKGKIFVESVK